MKKIISLFLFFFIFNNISYCEEALHILVIPDSLKDKIEDIYSILGEEGIFLNEYLYQPSLKNIYRAGNVQDVCPTTTALSRDDYIYNNIYLMLHSNITATDSIIFEGNSSIIGNGVTLDLGNNGEIVVAADSTLRLKNLDILNLKVNNIRCFNDTATIIFDNVTSYLDADYTFSYGSIVIDNKVAFVGEHTFTYDSNCTSSIHSHSQWDTRLADLVIGKKDTGARVRDPLYFEDSTSSIRLDNGSLIVTTSGLQLTRGTCYLDKAFSIDMNSTNTTNGIIIGDGTSDGNFRINLEPVAKINFIKGHLTYKNIVANGILSESSNIKWIRGFSDVLCIENDLNILDCIIDWHPVAFSNITGNGKLSFNNTVFSILGNKANFSGERVCSDIVLFNGGGINIITGQVITNNIIQGTGTVFSGIGNMVGDIALQDSDTELQFNLSNFSGDLTFNGGTIKLLSALSLGSTTDFIGTGTINLQSYKFSLPSDDVIWTSTINWESNHGQIRLESDLMLKGKHTFKGDCVINGNGHSINLDGGGTIEIEDGVELIIKKLKLINIAGSNIKCLGDNSKVILDDVVGILSEDYTFDKGSLFFTDDVDLYGSHTYNYSSSQTSTIGCHSRVVLDGGITFSIGKPTIDSPNPLYFENSSSELFLQQGILSVGVNGLNMSRGSLIIGKEALVDIMSTDTSCGLILGDGTAENDVKVDFRPGALCDFKSGALVYKNYTERGILSRSKTAKLLRGPTSKFYLATDVCLSGLSIDFDPASTLDGPGQLAYDDCSIAIPGCKFDISGGRHNNYTSYLAGDDYIFLSKGVLPMYVLVSGTNNSISGEGTLTGEVILNGADAQLSMALNGRVFNNIQIAGGSLLVSNDLVLGGDATIVGEGIIQLTNRRLVMGDEDLLITSTLDFEALSGGIELNSHISLFSQFSFSGDCIINGNGNILDLNSCGSILVANDSTLRLKNVNLRGVNNQSIRCLASSSKIIFEDSSLNLEEDFEFVEGAIEFYRKSYFCGQKNFIYQTNNIMKINAMSELHLENGITFSYDSISSNTNLIEFTDASSILGLKGASLCAVGSGLLLTKGKVIARDHSYIYSSSSNSGINNGITFGDGTVENDCILNIKPGAFLHIFDGVFNYNNVSMNSCVMEGFTSIIRITSDVIFNLYQDMYIEPGMINMNEDASLIEAEGKQIFGSIVPWDME